MSPKSTAEKLLIKPDTTLWVSHPERALLLGALPGGVREVGGPREAATAILFADDAASLRELLAAHGDELSAPAALWVAYPKGNRSDINRDSLWPMLREQGLRPISQISLSDVWSALRFRPLAPGEVFDP